MLQSEVKIRVRYGETDKMGFAYYGNYASYFEAARVEALRDIGFSYKEMEDGGVGMPVINLQTDYKSPAKYDDLLTVIVKIPEMPRARIRFEYEVYNESKVLLATGETTLVFMNLDSGRPVKMPAELKELLSNFYD